MLYRSILIACALMGSTWTAVAQECDPLATVIATEAQPTQVPALLKLSMKRLTERPEDPEIVLVGDSLLANWSKDQGDDFPQKVVWNFAVGGDRTQQVLWRLSQPGMPKISPKSVVILAGTNNLGDVGTPACAIVEGIRGIVGKTKALWPSARIFVLTIPPRGKDFKSFDAERIAINREIEAMSSDAKGIYAVQIPDGSFTCGMYDNPSALPSDQDRCLAPTAVICSNYLPDSLHFTRNGYLSLKDLLASYSLAKFGHNIFSGS